MRFAILGNGKIASRHKQAIEKIGGEVVAIYDPNDAGKIGFCASIDSMFQKDFEWVVITSPTNSHYQHLRTSLLKGKKIICEKPYVLPWQAVLDSPNVFVVLQLRWAIRPPTAKVIRVRATRDAKYFHSWKGDPLLTGGVFFNIFIHYVDLAMQYNCRLDLMVQSKGEQERWIDDFDFMRVDMDRAYVKMYHDIVFNGKGVRPSEVAKLNWQLAKYSERFGMGTEVLNKRFLLNPSELLK